MKYIAIDIGSSFVKSALLDPRTCQVVSQRKFPAPAKLPHSNRNLFEIPANQLFETVRELIEYYAREDCEASAVLLSTQMHGFVYQTPGREDLYISWQDMRCLDPLCKDKNAMEILSERFSRETMRDCGVYMKPSLGLCNLYALLNSDTSIPRDGKLFTIGSYITYRLTGNNVCHMSNAAPLGIADARRSRWRYDILEQAGLESICLPEIARSDFAPSGVYRFGGREILIYPDFGDQQVSILGSMAGSREAVINIATGSQVSITTDSFTPGDYETRPYFEGRYINTISNMPAGRNLDVLIRFLCDAVSRITGQNLDTEAIWRGIGDIPILAGDGIRVNMGFYSTPENLDGGAIYGIAPQNLTLSSLFSAALEDMAGTYWRNIDRLRGKMPIDSLVCAGGVSWKSPSLIRTIERVSRRACRLSPVPDESLAGLLRIALVCEGICCNLEDHPELKLVMKGSL